MKFIFSALCVWEWVVVRFTQFYWMTLQRHCLVCSKFDSCASMVFSVRCCFLVNFFALVLPYWHALMEFFSSLPSAVCFPFSHAHSTTSLASPSSIFLFFDAVVLWMTLAYVTYKRYSLGSSALQKRCWCIMSNIWRAHVMDIRVLRVQTHHIPSISCRLLDISHNSKWERRKKRGTDAS